MITIEKIEPIEKAFTRLRRAPLEEAGDEEILIYQNASMHLADFMPDELNPTSLYVLKDQLEFLRIIRGQILDRYQIDILQLSSILHLRSEDGRLLGMAPPIVEIYEETVRIVPLAGDRRPPATLSLQTPILKDGIHRAWIAREEGLVLRCVVVHGALKGYQPYAYPNAWSQVQIHDSKPKHKKFYRRQNPYSFMRPLKALRQTENTPPLPEWGR